MGLKTRKQIRQDFESVSAELQQLKSPEGLARYLISKSQDSDFEESFRSEVARIASEHSDLYSGPALSPEELTSNPADPAPVDPAPTDPADGVAGQAPVVS